MKLLINSLFLGLFLSFNAFSDTYEYDYASDEIVELMLDPEHADYSALTDIVSGLASAVKAIFSKPSNSALCQTFRETNPSKSDLLAKYPDKSSVEYQMHAACY